MIAIIAIVLSKNYKNLVFIPVLFNSRDEGEEGGWGVLMVVD